jgi:uncharacterized membrane protein
MNMLRAASLLAATITMGLAAGTFALYAHTVMPGLKKSDDHTFVAAFQSLDRAIINPWFMLGAFLGALLFTVLAALTNLGEDALEWIVAALVLYLVTFVVTIAVNVPLNDALKAAGDPDRIRDLAGVRERFHEARWAAWNLLRVATSLCAFGCLAWALVIYGRSTA